VTAEWFEARRGQLESLQSKAQADADKVFVCPLTGKRFQSEGTYESHTRTRKFKDALKKAGLSEAPAPTVMSKPAAPPAGQAAQRGESDVAAARRDMGRLAVQEEGAAQGDDGDQASGSGWETDTEASGEARCARRPVYMLVPLSACGAAAIVFQATCVLDEGHRQPRICPICVMMPAETASQRSSGCHLRT
jgi:hypothetical protein